MNPLLTRLTIVGSVYYQMANRQPKATPITCCFQPASTEQPLERELVVTTELRKLETAWIKGSCVVLIENYTGFDNQIQLTQDEKKEQDKHILELSEGENSSLKWLVHPGIPFLGCVQDPSKLWVRSLFGEVNCVVYLYPV